MSKELLELTLKNALNKLQNAVFDKEFLGTEIERDPAQMLETFFSFEIAAFKFVVNAKYFCEVLVDIQIASLPNSPSLLLGLCNIRGLLIPVYQLHSALNIALPKKSIVFCVGKGERAVGLLVDALPTSLQLRPYEKINSDVENNVLLRQLTDKAYFSAGKMCYEIDGEKVGKQLLELQVVDNYVEQEFSAVHESMSQNLFS